MVMVATGQSHSNLASFEGGSFRHGSSPGPSFPVVPMLTWGLPWGD